MAASHPVPYLAHWRSVPVVFLDFETTGIRPGIDRAVEVGLARFEHGELVTACGSLLNPGIQIPPASIEVHGITDAMVEGKPSVENYFGTAEVAAILAGAQPGAYNASFDRWFVPPWALADWTWPWVDALTLVRVADRYVRGPGRHKLPATCARHGITLANAHRASDDARAAGELFFKLMTELTPEHWGDEPPACIGDLVGWMRVQDAEHWSDFHGWLARQPAREPASP